MSLKHVIESQQFSREWLEGIFFPKAREMRNIAGRGGEDILVGKKMIILFYEASLRTRASFQIAMELLGGKVVFATENARAFSSAVKGESLSDTIRVLNRYKPDVIVLRYDEEGGARIAAEVSPVPVINAGDGPGQHPTQALLDIFTIRERLGRLDEISVAMVGDLAKGRTVRSLAYLLGKFSEVKIYFVAPESARIREDIKDYLRRHNVFFEEETDLRRVAPFLDVIYQTRTQRERGSSIDRSDISQGFFIVNGEILELMKKEAIIMHPLPRNEEITAEVDDDSRAVYLTEQVDAGFFTRMALLELILR